MILRGGGKPINILLTLLLVVVQWLGSCRALPRWEQLRKEGVVLPEGKDTSNFTPFVQFAHSTTGAQLQLSYTRTRGVHSQETSVVRGSRSSRRTSEIREQGGSR